MEKNNEFLGRTPKSWLRILFFYFTYYSALILLFYAFLYGYSITLPSRLRGSTGSKIQSRLGQPGLTVHPFNDYRDDKDNLEWVVSTNPDFTGNLKYVEISKSLLKKYQSIEKMTNRRNLCTETSPVEKTDFCTVENYRKLEAFSDWESDKLADALNAGEPVIFLALNKLVGWKPISYRYENHFSPKLDTDQFEKNSVTFRQLSET